MCAIERMSARRTFSSEGRSSADSSIGEDEALAAGLRRHHRRLGARHQLPWVGRVLGADCDPCRDRKSSSGPDLELRELLGEARGQRLRAPKVTGRKDDRELLASHPAHDVLGSSRGSQHVGDLHQELVSDPVPVDVVDLLEVVEVEHHQGDRVVLGGGTHHLLAKPIVERAVVVEAGERVGGCLVLEPRTYVRVVDGERSGVAEACGEVELLVGELGLLADAIDVERPLQPSAGDQRHGDERLRIDRRAGNEADPGIEVRLVRENRLAVDDRPAGDALVEREGLAHDLGLPLAAGEHGNELALGLVGLVDVDVLVRDELRERVRDPLEQRGRVVLREDVVEDLGQPAIWLGRARRDEAHLRASRRLEALGALGRRVRHTRGLDGLIGTLASPLERPLCEHHPS